MERGGGVGATWSSSQYTSKTDSTISQLKFDLNNLRQKYGELRRNAENEWRRRESELCRKFQTKLETVREKWRIDKQREFENALAQAKRDYEQRLTTAMQIKEKELNRLKYQKKTNLDHHINHNHNLRNYNSLPSPYHSQDSFGAAKLSDTHHQNQTHQKAHFELVELRERLAVLQDQLCQSDKLVKEKDEQIVVLRNAKTAAAQTASAESQRRIRALLEEIRRKEREINKLENSLKSVEHQLVRATSSFCTSLNVGQEVFNDTMSGGPSVGKMAPVAPATNKPVSATMPNGVTKEEYDKEKQRWALKQNELESQLKASEQSNGELVQIKADLIRRIKEFEKTQKLLQDSYKKLTDKHKQTCLELKQMEDKFKQCQDENINLKQNLEKTSAECNKLKEKRARCEKLEEVEKLRQQTLDYCKTISALKQTNIEKDRRLDLLHQKFKRIKRCRNRTVDISFLEDDNKSSLGSDRSISSTSLNTITEDWAELPREELESNYRQLAKNYLELQRVYLSLSRCHVEFSNTGPTSEIDLATKYQEALKKIDEMEKLASTTNALGADAEWAQEKIKYTSLTKSLRDKIDALNEDREKLEFELQEAREQNELLEFQNLELQQQSSAESSSSNSLSSKCTVLCDRSVSTSEDEGISSFDGSDDSCADFSERKVQYTVVDDQKSSTVQKIALLQEFTLDDLKIRFTLLKHRKELRPDDRHVICAVKEVWESLQSQHSQFSSKQMEWELKFRESETNWKSQLDTLKQQLETLTEKKKKRLKLKEVENELEICRVNLSECQRVNVDLEKRLRDCNVELEKVQYLLKIVEEAKLRERHTVQELRTQIQNMTQGRSAEIELLENATNSQTKELDALRRKESQLEEEIGERENIDQLLEERKQLQEKLDEQRRVETKLRQQLQNAQDSCKTMEQKFQDALKTIRQLEKNEVKTAEELNDLISVNETLTKTVEALHEKQLENENRCVEIESKNSTLQETIQANDAKNQIELETLRNKLVDEIETLKNALRRNETLMEEKSSGERRASGELSKLQRQLTQMKSYSKQLEAQFEIQLQTVQILKDQMIHLQRMSMEKDAQLQEMEKKFSQNRTELFCPDDLQVLAKLQKLLHILPENFNSTPDVLCKINNMNVEPDSLDDPSELKLFRQYVCRLIKYVVELKEQMDELRLETDLAHREAEKANSRADKLCKQYRDTIAQIGDVKKEIIMTNGTDIKRDLINKCNDSGDLKFCSNGRQFVENIIVQLKTLLSKSCTDIEVLNELHSVLCNVIKEGECRTLSPLEFSGTESEICGDKSPTLERYLTSSSSSNSDQLSPRQNQADHSSFEEDSLSDSCLNPVKRQKRKNAKTLRRTCSATFDERADQIFPPTFVKLESDLHDGRYIISWGPPSTMFGVGGYKVYINGHVCKTISNALCSKTMIECTNNNHKANLESLSVATLSKNFRQESNPVTITLV